MLAALLLSAVGAVAATAPSPSPTPASRFAVRVSGSNVFVDQATGGPGTTPPQGDAFAHGSPAAPMSPYDWLGSAPVTPGVAGITQYELTGSYRGDGFDFAATFGIGGISGSTTNALYWGEPTIANLNVHDLSRMVPYAVVFPTHAGQDDATVAGANLLGLSLFAPDDSWRVRGGYLDLTQSDRFVFNPPAITSVTPSLGPSTAETLGPGLASVDGWAAAPTSLPLLGADAYWHRGGVSAELTDALLPSLPGTQARLTIGSFALDRGDAGRFSVQVAHVATSGAPIATTTFFGSDQELHEGPQGRLFTSTLANQDQTIAGARAFFHPLRGWDALAEIGRAWYDAGVVAYPGTSHFGNYEHFSIARHLGDDVATLEYHRFDPTYATVILPYGIPENVWSIAWSWPGVWLKSNYQLVDNSTIGANRAGYHLRYDHSGKRFEVHASYGDWRQLLPETEANASQVGFVDGFFLLQKNGFGTLGRDRQAGLYVAWHALRDDVSVDAVDDFLSRAADAGQAIDTVSTRAPQTVFAWTHHFSHRLLAAAGYGRYALAGTWATTAVDGIYGVAFAGVQIATTANTALLVQARRYALVGLPSIPEGPPPAMHGTALIVDQRISL